MATSSWNDGVGQAPRIHARRLRALRDASDCARPRQGERRSEWRSRRRRLLSALSAEPAACASAPPLTKRRPGRTRVIRRRRRLRGSRAGSPPPAFARRIRGSPVRSCARPRLRRWPERDTPRGAPRTRERVAPIVTSAWMTAARTASWSRHPRSTPHGTRPQLPHPMRDRARRHRARPQGERQRTLYTRLMSTLQPGAVPAPRVTLAATVPSTCSATRAEWVNGRTFAQRA